MKESIFWSDYTWEELKAIISQENPLVIVHVGATEQHGPFLPLNTDTDIGFQLAQRIAQASPVRTLVLPSIWTGFSPHHMDFTGTITVKQSTLFALTFDVLESLIHHGIERILLLNSHGGNMALLKTVVDEIAVKYGLTPVYTTYWQMISDIVPSIRQSELGGMAHACELETSLKMVFSPSDVRNDRIEDVMIPGDSFYNVDMFAANRISWYHPFKRWTPTGQMGAPSLASPETGQRLLDALIERYVQFIRNIWLSNSNEIAERHRKDG